MDLKNTFSQLSTQDLKTRELAQDYCRIEQNTQFLTNLQRYRPRCKRVEIDLTQQTPDIKCICSLVVQLAYFLFTCHVKQSNVFISHKLVMLMPQRQHTQLQVAFEYLLEKDLYTFTKAEQQFANQKLMKHELGPQNLNSYGDTVLKYMTFLLGIARFQIQKLKIVQDKQMVGYFIGLEAMIKRYLEPKIKTINNPRVVILCLEQTQLFRQHSLLLKVMNNSLFSALRQCQNTQIFHQILALETPVTHQRQRDPFKHTLEMQNSIENFMKLMIKNQLVMIDQSINESICLQQKDSYRGRNSTQEGSRKEYVLGEVQGQGHERRYVCRMQIPEKPTREMNGQIFEQIVQQANNEYSQQESRSLKPDRKGMRRNEFVVEYLGARGMLVVKYITSIELNIENTDAIMIQCNNIAYHWSYATIELHQRMSVKGAKKKERFIAFKTVAHLALAENPLLKLMAMADLVMMCGKVGEPELRLSSITKGEDNSHRIQVTSNKVEHMLQLFVLKIEKYYRAIAESCGQQ